MKKFNTRPTGVTLQARTLLLCAIIALLTACSSVRLAYGNGDTLLYWWLDAYVDLESDQKVRVRQDIDDLFGWHRKTQLRDYAQLLTRGQRRLQDEATQADLLADYNDIKQRARALLYRAEPDLANLARALRPEQIAHMEKKFASNNDEYRKKFLRGDNEQRQQVRFKKSMEQFELWFGGFSGNQEEQIRQASDARPLDNELWFDERIRRQGNILGLVRKVRRDNLDQAATVALVHQLIKESFERLDMSERKSFFDAYTDATAHMILAVIKMATPAQKAHAVKRMRGWSDDFNTLAAIPH